MSHNISLEVSTMLEKKSNRKNSSYVQRNRQTQQMLIKKSRNSGVYISITNDAFGLDFIHWLFIHDQVLRDFIGRLRLAASGQKDNYAEIRFDFINAVKTYIPGYIRDTLPYLYKKYTEHTGDNKNVTFSDSLTQSLIDTITKMLIPSFFDDALFKIFKKRQMDITNVFLYKLNSHPVKQQYLAKMFKTQRKSAENLANEHSIFVNQQFSKTFKEK